MSTVIPFDQTELDAVVTQAVSANDPAEFTEMIQGFTPNTQVTKVTRDRFKSSMKAVRTPNIALFRVRATNIQVGWDPRSDYLSTTIPLSGSMQVSGQDGTVEFCRNAGHILRPDLSGVLRSHEACSCLVLNLSEPLVRKTMMDLNNSDYTSFSPLEEILDLSRDNGASFFRMTIFYWSEFFATSALQQSPKMIEYMENVLANSFVLAARKMDGANEDQANRVEPKLMKAALDCLHADLGEPITLAQIAANTGVNARTLTRSFHRAHGLGPVSYHRRRRLERANLELIAASAAETSVTDIAMKYGFYQLSHFAAAYKRHFGESPSETLQG